MESFMENLKLASLDINFWKKKYIKKQKKKYPNISIKELSKKIKNAKASYFNRHHKEFHEVMFQDILSQNANNQKEGNK